MIRYLGEGLRSTSMVDDVSNHDPSWLLIAAHVACEDGAWRCVFAAETCDKGRILF